MIDNLMKTSGTVTHEAEELPCGLTIPAISEPIDVWTFEPLSAKDRRWVDARDQSLELAPARHCPNCEHEVRGSQFTRRGHANPYTPSTDIPGRGSMPENPDVCYACRAELAYGRDTAEAGGWCKPYLAIIEGGRAAWLGVHPGYTAWRWHAEATQALRWRIAEAQNRDRPALRAKLAALPPAPSMTNAFPEGLAGDKLTVIAPSYGAAKHRAGRRAARMAAGDETTV